MSLLVCRPKKQESSKKKIEKRFKHFARTKCSICNTMDLYQVQRTRYRSKKTSGDVLVNTPIVNGELKIELIEGEQVTTPHNMEDTETIIDGVQLNRFRQPTHYFVQKKHPGSQHGSYEWNRFRAIDLQGRVRMHLDKEVRRPNQVRGVPILSTVLECMRKLDEYSDNELEAARNSSAPTTFVQKPYVGSPDWSNNPIDIYPGGVVNLEPGETVSFPTPGRPNREYTPFVHQKILEFCIASKMPRSIFMMMFNASFSASRGDFLIWKKVVNEERKDESASDDIIFSVWLDNEVRNGLDIPNYEETAKYWRTSMRWNGPALGSIKELEEIKSAKERIDADLSTRKKEAAEMGQDIEEIDAVLEQERENNPDPEPEEENTNVPSD